MTESNSGRGLGRRVSPRTGYPLTCLWLQLSNPRWTQPRRECPHASSAGQQRWALPSCSTSPRLLGVGRTVHYLSFLQQPHVYLQTSNKSLFSSLSNWFFVFGVTGEVRCSEGGSSSAEQSSMLLLTDTGVPFFCLFHWNSTYLTCAQTVIHSPILFHRLAAQSFCLPNWAMKSLTTKAPYLVASLKRCRIPSYLFRTVSLRHRDKFEFSTLPSPD